MSMTMLILVAALTAEKPNVVLILADDLGYGDLGCYGQQKIKTPHLDRLAAEGIRFTDFYVTQAVCSASRASLMTGCYANRVGLEGALNHTSRIGIHSDELLLPELFRSQGYATAIFGKWHLGLPPHFSPLKHGFDRFLGLPYSNDNSKYHPVLAKEMDPLPLYQNETIVERDPDQSQFTQRLTDAAIKFIEEHRTQPFFVYLPHIMPHVPIFASAGFVGKSAGGLYGDVVEELDANVGRLLQTLEQLGLTQNTMVIFASDNGPFLSYGSHAGSAGPLREGKLTAFEGGVRVPGIMRWPGRMPPASVCDQPVMTIDLVPTFADLLGASLSKNKLDGVNIRRLLAEPQTKIDREALYFYSGAELHAVRHGDWKLHFPHSFLTMLAEPGRDGKPSGFGRLQPQSIQQSDVKGIASRHGYRIEDLPLSLFNLRDDVGETTNVAAQQPEVVAKLLALGEQARVDLGDKLTGRIGANVRSPGQAPQ